MNRCLNCGIPGHKERHCPRYGPYYPEPGKTKEDYAEQAAQIMDLMAQDIVKEHDGPSEDDDTPFVATTRGHISQRELEYRTVSCDWCYAEAGSGCKSSNGTITRVHKTRVDKYKEKAHGVQQEA